VATPTLYFLVVALVHVPELDVLIPRGDHVIPGRCRVVAMDAVLASPPGMPGLVTVCANIVQPLKVRKLVTLEAMQLAVRTRKLNGMAGRINLCPRVHRRVTAGTGQILGHIVGSLVAYIAAGHLDPGIAPLVAAFAGPQLCMAIHADHHGAGDLA
jgi:hypothetical protein